MAINFDQVNVHVRQLIKKQLFSSFVQVKPLIWFLAGQSVQSLDTLGDPKSGAVFGGIALGQATMKTQAGSFQHEFRFQSAEPDASSHVTLDGSTPVSTVFVDDLMKKAATRWTNFMAPLRIRQHRLDAAKGDLAIGSLFEEAMAVGFNKSLEKHQTELWTGTLTEAQQDLEVWPTYLGLQHTCDGTGTDFYGGQSRATYDMLRGKEYAATALATAGAITASTTVPLLQMFRHMKTNNTVGGIANRYAGAGSLVITTPDLWNVLATEAEGKHTIFDSNTEVPGMMLHTGMKYPIIKKDTTFITYDPDCPSGELYQLTPEFWVYEVEKGNNFKVMDWKNKWETDEGGAYYVWNQIFAKARLTCHRPDLQIKITGLTTS
jgi:hypothetical protein